MSSRVRTFRCEVTVLMTAVIIAVVGVGTAIEKITVTRQSCGRLVQLKRALLDLVALHLHQRLGYKEFVESLSAR